MSLDVYVETAHPACACCGRGEEVVTHWTGNVTHNLTRMADHVGLYRVLWQPETLGLTRAWQLVDTLEAGLARLEEEAGACAEFAPKNGWGTHSGLVTFVRAYLDACRAWPTARIVASP